MVYIALLRSINVGGRSILAMKDLVGIFEDLGLQNVQTYIQSGNVIFTSQSKNRSKLSQKIITSIQQKRGFSPAIILLTLEELRQAVDQTPFQPPPDKPQTLHLGFLESVPGHPDLEKLLGLQTNGEQFALIGQVFYLLAPNGVGKSRLAGSTEKALGVNLTDRNWSTVQKILEIAEEMERDLE